MIIMAMIMMTAKCLKNDVNKMLMMVEIIYNDINEYEY